MESSAAPTSNPSDTNIAPDAKRRKLSLKVSLEAGSDGRLPVFQTFADGTATPAIESHFERTSAAASAFAARALAPPPAASASADTRATDSDASQAQWAAAAVTNIEGALYELGRAITVIEALRADTPLLALSRVEPKQKSAHPASSRVPATLLKDGSAMLMAKRRSMLKCADGISGTVDALKSWVDADNAFCDAVVTLRKKCCGLRRTPNGTPLIDVGSNEFTAVKRSDSTNVASSSDQAVDSNANNDEQRHQKQILNLNFPAFVYLKFGINSIDEIVDLSTAPTVIETGADKTDQSVKAIIRRIRLSRVAAWRRISFERLAREATNSSTTTHLTTNTIGFESGPSDIVRLERTQRSAAAISIEPWSDDSQQPSAEEYERVQTASLLQIISTHACLIHAAEPHNQPTTPLLDYLLDLTASRRVLTETEKILDSAAKLLRLRLEWSRGSMRTAEARVRVHATDADGDGPSRPLAIVEPVSVLNDGAHAAHRGHVRITPSFGVIIPAPDDPSARGRAIPLPSSSSSGASALGLDDVPRSYICPIGGEVLSVFTLLLCIRLLDSLETAARAGVGEMLDVDRQCFTVVVSSPRTGRTLKVKAWPRGETVGHEVPGATAWLDGQRVSFPQVGPGRLKAWKELLHRLMKHKKEEEVVKNEKEVLIGGNQGPLSTGHNLKNMTSSGQPGASQQIAQAAAQAVPAVSLQVPGMSRQGMPGEGMQAIQAQLQAQLQGQSVLDPASATTPSANQVNVAGNDNSNLFSLDAGGSDANKFDFDSYMT